MSRRADGIREVAGVTLLASVLAVYFTFPLAIHPGSLGRTDSFDGQFSIWNVAWVAHALLTPGQRVLDANIFYPHRGTLAYSEANLGAGVLGVPGYALTGNPHVAHNSAVLIGLALSVIGMYFLARRLSGSRPGAVVAAIAFSFCPYVFGRTAHIQLLMFWPIPFVLLVFHTWVDRHGAARSCLLGLAIAVQGLFCAYYGVLVGLMVAFGVVFYGVSRGHWRKPSWWGSTLLAAGVSMAVVLPAFLPYVGLQRETGFHRALEEARDYSADWRAYFVSNAWLHEWMLKYLVTWKEVLFPGFTAIVLGITGIAAGLRRHRRAAEPAPVIRISRETTIFYALIGLLALWCSFGPDAGLYALLYHTVPVFSLLRAPARFGIAVSLALALLSSAGAAAVLRSVSEERRRWLAGGIMVVVVAELSMTMPYRRVPALPRVYDVLAASRPGPVVELPFYFNSHDFNQHSAYMLASTRHWLPLVNGYSDYLPPDVLKAAFLVASFPNPEGFDFLRARQVRYAVFHLGAYDWTNRTALLFRFHAYREYLRPMVKYGDVWLFEIVRWPDKHPNLTPGAP